MVESESKLTIKMIQTKETPGAFQFFEVNEEGVRYQYPNSPGCAVGGIYIRKTALPRGSNPKKLRVVIHYED